MKYFLILLCVTFAMCKPSEKKKPEIVDDRDVLRPREGYGNPRFSRPAYFADSMNKLYLSAKPVPCQQVQNLMPTSIAATSVSLFWQSTGAKKYIIYQNTIDAKGGVKVGESATNKFIVQSLQPGTTYYFSVAMAAQGNKVCDISDPVQAVTTGPQPPPPPPPSGGTTNVEYLEFGPVTVTGTSWNTSYGSSIVSSGSNLTDVEQQGVLEMVKQAYASHPKVTVTADKAVYDAADPASRHMTIFTVDFAWYCGSTTPCAGGVSFVGNKEPSWVFTSALNYSVLNNGIAAPHEMGHSLGCYHNVQDCSQSYGQARQDCNGNWLAPIMGGSYSPYPHYFYTPAKGAQWCFKDLAKNTCAEPDEDSIIENHLK